MTKQEILDYLDERKDDFVAFSDQIWSHPELCYKEFQSAKDFTDFLKKEGFRVTEGAADIPTAFVAEYGQGKPILAFLAEYDALPGLSQKGNTAVQCRIEGQEDGHGCGHNLLGTASLAAAVAMKKYLEVHPEKGTIRLYGTPAEEGGNAKCYMVRDGLFEDVDAAIIWHPDNMNYMVPSSLLAVISMRYRFTGIGAHAAMCPQRGRSALDAVTLMNVGSEFLREHVTDDVRIHYAITNSGAIYSNVVPKEAEVSYMIRAPHLEECIRVRDRLDKIARGAAMMTETEVEISLNNAMAEMLPNVTLDQMVHRNFMELGPTPVTEEDIRFAEEIRATLSPEQQMADEDRMRGIFGGEIGEQIVEKLHGKPISDFVYPYISNTGILYGSTDAGDVSQVVPTSQFSVCCFPQGMPNHTWQIVSCAVSNLGHSAMLHAGKLMAVSAAELFENPAELDQAKEEFRKRRGGKPYQSLIPPEKKPF